jgi:hypothetical protein
MEAEAIPFPKDETTPPVTNMYLVISKALSPQSEQSYAEYDFIFI